MLKMDAVNKGKSRKKKHDTDSETETIPAKVMAEDAKDIKTSEKNHKTSDKNGITMQELPTQTDDTENKTPEISGDTDTTLNQPSSSKDKVNTDNTTTDFTLVTNRKSKPTGKRVN